MNQSEQLRAPLPGQAIKKHPTKDYLSTVNSAFIIERLNDVFGEDGWKAEYRVVEGDVNHAMVVVECRLSCRPTGEINFTIQRQTFGGNDNKDRGDAYKGACTDALTKAASQIGIAQDVYKGAYDKELMDEGKKTGRKPKQIKNQFEVVDGIVTKHERMGPGALWLQVNGLRIRTTEQDMIAKLANCAGKRVELRCRWDYIGKTKTPVLTIINVMGIWEPVPNEPQYVPDAEVQGVPLEFK